MDVETGDRIMEHTEEELKRFIDACGAARRIVETMPELPKGIKPRHIHVIDAVVLTGEKKEKVQVSDISRHLNVTMPSVTRLVSELEERGVLEKYADAEDGRNVLLKLTPLGESYYRRYVREYYQKLGIRFENISPEDLRTTIRTIQTAYQCIRREKVLP